MRCDAMRYDAVRCGTMRYDAIRCGTMRYDAVRCGTMRYGENKLTKQSENKIVTCTERREAGKTTNETKANLQDDCDFRDEIPDIDIMMC